MSRTTNLDANLDAFLDMLSVSEGTFGIGDDGYNVIVGSTAEKPILFHDYAKHPNVRVNFNYRNGARGVSTAAGRYQILYRYARHYMRALNLPDFSPVSQDAIALQLIKECRATAAIKAGRIEEAISLTRSRWASLPGAGYNQHEHDIATLLSTYRLGGGTLA